MIKITRILLSVLVCSLPTSTIQTYSMSHHQFFFLRLGPRERIIDTLKLGYWKKGVGANRVHILPILLIRTLYTKILYYIHFTNRITDYYHYSQV